VSYGWQATSAGKPERRRTDENIPMTEHENQRGRADMSGPRRARGRALVTPKRVARRRTSPGAEERRGFFVFEA